MSIRPVDKPPDGENGRRPPRSPRSAIRQALGRCVSWFASHVRDALSVVEEPATRTPHAAEPAPATDGSRGSAVSTGRPSVEGVPEREYPLTYPARELSGRNAPDVVSVHTAEGFRISVPDNPEATLTSDEWTTVEP